MLATAFLLGLAGSLHCAAMCGPLVLALPIDRRARWAAARDLAIFQVGRASMYAVLGLGFGAVGQAVAWAGFQKWMGLGAGFLLIGAAFFSFKSFEKGVQTALPSLARLTDFVKKGLSKRLASGSFFSLGMLNGLLPCGLVYAAIAGAAATGGAFRGAFFMFIFGAGTWPMLFAVGLGGQFFKKMARKMGWLQTVLLVAAGVLTIWRAAALDVSIFENWLEAAKIPMCH